MATNKTKRKAFRYSLISIVVILIGILIFFIINTILNIDKTSELRILVAPSDSIVTIDGKKFGTNTTIRLKPGEHDVKIEKSGFVSFHDSITTTDKKTSYLYEYLNEINENGTYYEDNERENITAQRITDLKSDIFQQQYTGTDPIWNVTPYYNYQEGIKITAEKSENGNPIVNIYLLTCIDEDVPNLKQKAIDYLEENKITLKNYTINYDNC